ncbi:prostatic acid phosphatase isoform X2 [Lissotriton helveticus]
MDRTLMSAQANLAGMYPPTGEQIWNPEIPWQPIPVHTLPLFEEQLLLYPIENCPRFNELLKETLKSTQFQTIIEPYQDFIQKVSNDTGYPVNVLINAGKLWIVYDTLLCEEIHNLTLPTWATPEVRATLLKVSQILLKTLFGLYKQEEKSRLQGGVLVGAVLKNITDFVTTPTKRKMIMYSAHDTALVALQMALNVYNDQLPPYAACHIFELYQEDNGQYSIDMFYRNDTGADPHALLLPDCGTPCILQQFSDLVSPIIAKDWKKECGIQDESSTTAGQKDQQQDPFQSRTSLVRWWPRPLSTSEEEKDEAGPSTSGGRGIVPTRTEQEDTSGATGRVEAEDIEGWEEELDTSGQEGEKINSLPDHSPLTFGEVSSGQATTQPGPAISPSQTLAAPISLGPPAASPATSPPPHGCQADTNIDSKHEAPHPSIFTQTPPSLVTAVAGRPDLMWTCEDQQDMACHIKLQMCCDLRIMQEKHSRALATLTRELWLPSLPVSIP